MSAPEKENEILNDINSKIKRKRKGNRFLKIFGGNAFSGLLPLTKRNLFVLGVFLGVLGFYRSHTKKRFLEKL